MKVLFVWRKIGGVAGGVERMITVMMNDLIQKGHEVALLTWDQEDAQAYYDISDKVEWHKLGIGDPTKKAGWGTRFKRMGKVRNAVKEINPDAIFCLESGVFLSTRLFLLGFNVPFIAAERNAPSRHQFSNSPNKRFQVFGILGLANYVTVQFERYVQAYPAFLRHKMHAINNPVIQVEEKALPAEPKDGQFTLLSVARLDYQKNIGVLIDAFDALSEKYPEWVLKIAGDGQDEARLRKKVNGLQSKDKINILGKVKDVKSLYMNSHLFCLPARYEGFPNALAESMSHGLPAVGYAQCCGVRDLIMHGKTGYLAEGNGDLISLTYALDELMGDHQLREEMGTAAKESVKKYEPQNMLDEWETFFLKVSSSKN